MPKVTSQSYPLELVDLKNKVYEFCGFKLAHYCIEQESREYSACEFLLNDFRIKYRKARVTPTKVGQFVTFWKRSKAGPIEPFDFEDGFDFLVVCVTTKSNEGQFIFPKSELVRRGVVSHNGRGGLRALRVYPPWDKTINAQSKKTQFWQIPYFVDTNISTDFSRVTKILSLSNCK